MKDELQRPGRLPLPGRRGARASLALLLAFDLDGTVLEDGSHITPQVLDALRELATRGIRCVTASGRPLAFQVELFRRLELPGEFGAPHALIVDERELYVLDGLAEQRPDGRYGDGRGEATYVPYSPWNDWVRQRWSNLHPHAMLYLQRAQAEAARRGWQAWEHLDEAEARTRGLPTLAFEHVWEAVDICDWLRPLLAASGVPLTCNRNGGLLQIHDSDVGKGAVLAELARLWGIPPQQVLAVGDSANDADMLDGHLGFRCAAVGNAEESIKDLVRQAGGYVATAHAGMGLIEALRALGVGDGTAAAT